MVSVSLEAIIDSAMSAVERERGLRGLSFRAIARDMGCSHVNLYHYVESLDALIWRVYARALQLLRQACGYRIAGRSEGETKLHAYAAGMVAFAMEHEGYCRILWFEQLRGAPPSEIQELIGRMSGEYAQLGIEGLSELGCASELETKAEIFFSFLHGRIAILLNGHVPRPAAEEAKRILHMADRLIAALVTQAG
jgi:AcrR family transcriptional regulator